MVELKSQELNIRNMSLYSGDADPPLLIERLLEILMYLGQSVALHSDTRQSVADLMTTLLPTESSKKPILLSASTECRYRLEKDIHTGFLHPVM